MELSTLALVPAYPVALSSQRRELRPGASASGLFFASHSRTPRTSKDTSRTSMARTLARAHSASVIPRTWGR